VPDRPVELLERAEQLAALHDRLTRAGDGGAGGVVLISGEAGVGKTALLRRFCTEAEKARVLWGACDGLFTPRPLGPLFDVAQVTSGELGALANAGAPPHEVAIALLRELALQTPTVLVLEDLHWADEATLDVVRLLARRIHDVPALVLVSYRDDELDRLHPLRTVLGELVRFEGAERMRLVPLTAAGVAELAGSHAALDADDLYRTTAGNPFFVTEVLAAPSDEIPQTVRDAVLARTTRLSTAAESLLEAIAVVPQQAELWLVETVAGDVREELDECLASGILAAAPGAVGFRHELARLAIEESIPPTRRVELHRKVVAALADQPAATRDLARLAHHAEAAGDAEAVLQFAPQAAERAASLGAHREAAAQYGRALRFGDRLPAQERAELLVRRADQCYLGAQLEEAIEAQQEAHAWISRLNDPYAIGDSLRSLARLLAFAGRTAEPDSLALEAVALLETLPPRHELAMAYGAVAQRRMAASDTEGVAYWGGRALELARRLDDTEALVYALTTVGSRELDAGLEAGRTKLEEAIDLAQHHSLDEYVGRAMFQLVHAPLRNRELGAVAEVLESSLAYCSDRGLETWRQYLLACRASMKLQLGDWDQAAESAVLVLEDPRAAPVARGWTLATLGRLRARRGDPDAASLLDEAHALTHASGEIFRIGPVSTARAEAAWLRGDHAALPSVTDAALALALEREAWWEASELVYWRRHAGVQDGTGGLPEDNPYVLAMGGASAESARRWRAIGCPYEAALALADGGDPDELHAALADLRALGAEPASVVVSRRLRERGERIARGPRTSTRSNPAGLTSRELEVLHLLVEGLRNAEIASSLVVSERTIDHHVAAILRKLQVRTRSEASTEAIRRGLATLGPRHA